MTRIFKSREGKNIRRIVVVVDQPEPPIPLRNAALGTKRRLGRLNVRGLSERAEASLRHAAKLHDGARLSASEHCPEAIRERNHPIASVSLRR